MSGQRESRIPTPVGFASDPAANILGNSIQLFSAWLRCTALNPKAVTVKARHNVKMHMEYVLPRYFAISQEEIDSFASNVTSSSCFRHLLSYLE